MRIGAVTTSYPRFAGDPAGNFVGEHVAAMRALGHDVEVIAAGEPGARYAEPGVTRIASALFYGGGAPDAIEGGGRFGDAARFSARLALEVARRARRWDRVIAHWLAPSALAALPTSVPLTAIAHGGDVHTLARANLLTGALALLRARRAKLVFVSEALRELAAAHGPIGHAIVQPMGIDVARFAAIDRAPTAPASVLVLARLVPIKGVDVAIAALDRVRARVDLVIAGDGPERARLEALAAGRANVRFLGEVSTRERDALLARASLVAIPSRVLPGGRTEGMPVVALEALSAGVPVVASGVGGLADLAEARLVSPDDPDALAHAIDRTLAAPPSPDRLRASVAHCDWPAIAKRVLAL